MINTRTAYKIAIDKFMKYVNLQGKSALEVHPLLVNDYFGSLQCSNATIKQHAAAVRTLYDFLVTSHLVPFNPASSYKNPRQKRLKE